ncbi:MAG: hypothetical protein ACYSUI_19575 [Planctomycetota bacterium]
MYEIDDLERVVASHREARRQEAAQGELLIEREWVRFEWWLNSLEVVPTIVDMRQQVVEIREAELDRALGCLQDLDPAQQEVVQALAHGITNKVLHHPTAGLKRQSADRDDHMYVNALRRLFGLRDDD